MNGRFDGMCKDGPMDGRRLSSDSSPRMFQGPINPPSLRVVDASAGDLAPDTVDMRVIGQYDWIDNGWVWSPL
jgi:hypothetical protein